MLPYDLSLITIHIADYRQFSDIHISQGSVATYVTYGGTFKHHFVANSSLSLPVKVFGEVMGKCLVRAGPRHGRSGPLPRAPRFGAAV